MSTIVLFEEKRVRRAWDQTTQKWLFAIVDAIAAHDGFARALWPAHTPLDGDLVFALATGKSGRTPAPEDFIALCAAAAATMARAIARGVHDATPMEGDVLPSWAGR